MRFLRRSTVVKNIFLFCLLSVFFLSVVNSLFSGVSALSVKNFILFLEANKKYLAFASIVILSVVRGAKISPYLFFIFCIITLGQSLNVFLREFDKIILGLSFLYSIVAYNLFLFLKLELREPYYNPEYPSNILSMFENKTLPIQLKVDGKSKVAYLTNWGVNGFFCRLENGESCPKGRVEIEVNYKGHTFQAAGVVMFLERGGVGVRVYRNPVPELGWPDFYGIISELGLRPC